MDHFSKFLDEDVDETLHSGAAVDALTAQLNREVGGSFPQNGAPKLKDLPQNSQNPNLESQQSSEKSKPKPPTLQMQSVPANQQAPAGDKKPATPKAAPTIPFQMLMPILRPHLDKDRDMQLQQIFTKLRSNEVSKEDFLRVIRNIVGDQMLRQAAHTVHMKMQSEALKASSQSQTSPNPNPNPTSSTATSNPNPAPNPNPNPNPNNYSLLSQSSSSSSSQQFYSQKVSLGSSPSPSQLHPQTDKTEVNKRTPQTVNRPPHQQPQHFNPSSFPPRPTNNNPPAPLIRPPTTGQVAGGNWPRGVGSTFGPAYVKQEQGEGNKGQPVRDDFLNRGLPRIGAPGPGPPAMVGGPGAGPGPQQLGHAEPSPAMQTPLMAAKAPAKKPVVGQKKPIEGSSPPPASKKQKTGGHLDQSIEQLNDVTAVSGVNLREEEEQLLSAPKEDSRISEATRRVVQEEEERLILQKGPLHKKLMEILAKSNLGGVGSDVERCLSMCVEERLKGIIANLVRLSKQRVDLEKSKHRVIVSSDVHTHIMNENKKAKEEWDKKQAEEAEKMKKQNEVEGTANTEAEKDKDDKNSSKNIKVNKEEDDKMRTTAANVAARAAVGGDDMLTKWQMMAEQARQKREGLDSSGPSKSSSNAFKPVGKFGSAKEQREEEERREARRQAGGGEEEEEEEGGKVRRSVCLKDVIAVLEREPGLGRSSLVYKLYERVGE
ncbi:hypothetical protein LUZ60_006426 [Juncus effusus]|nr:hypothetical protein LUZ60_006426 [Juncus effusus]